MMTSLGPSSPVVCGILGAGGFAGHRRQSLREARVFRLIACVEPVDETFANAQAEEGGILKRYSSAEEMAADPKIEAVFVSTPAGLHLAQAWPVARTGKALFTEKPLGHDLEECRRLVEYCETHSIPHGHGFAMPFRPLWREVERILKSGLLGRVVSVSAATMHSGGLAFSNENWRFARKANPGGPLFQCGIHKIDMLRRLFGEGRWLAGLVQNAVAPSETDDSYVLLGQFGEVPVTFHSHYVTAYRHSMEIYGTEGNLLISEYPEKLEYKRTNLTGGTEPVEDLTTKIPPSDAESESLRDFAASVRGRRQPAMSGRDGLRALEMVFSAAEIASELRPPSTNRKSAP